eukprot:5919840-Karenia_brevis.AAC.1
MDKESDAYHQHSIAMQAVEMADESEYEEDMKPSTSMDPAEFSDWPISACGCFEDQMDFARAFMAGRKEKRKREAEAAKNQPEPSRPSRAEPEARLTPASTSAASASSAPRAED